MVDNERTVNNVVSTRRYLFILALVQCIIHVILFERCNRVGREDVLFWAIIALVVSVVNILSFIALVGSSVQDIYRGNNSSSVFATSAAGVV
jgi:hypothetical protein